MVWNAHRALTNSGEKGSYLANIKVDKDCEARLTDARDSVRDALRQGFAGWENLVQRGELFAGVPSDWRLPALRPKFRMQGSFAYRTHVAPAWDSQQTDLDDGLFLPVSFVTRNDSLEPMLASEGLFKLAEAILEPLCHERGWILDSTKPSCVRIQLSKQEHVDVALYAISDEAFLQLLEKAAVARKGDPEAAKRSLRESIDLDDLIYASLAGDQIALAHRTTGWKRSDPRKLDDWFHNALKEHGEQFRRVCRYFKGWRDFQFTDSRLASIAVMAAVEEVYRQAFMEEERDDLALLEVANRLPEILRSRIENPVVAGERLDEGWSSEERAKYVSAARRLSGDFGMALNAAGTAAEALEILRTTFGDRLPDDETLISGDDSLETKAAAISAPAAVGLGEADRRSKLEAAFSESSQSYGSKPWAGPRD